MLSKFRAPKLHNHIFSLTHRKNAGYDIPLHTRLGTEFLVMLIALMTYLLLLAATGSISLGHLGNKWVAGLENTMTIEIPSSENAMPHAEKLVESLKNASSISSARILTNDDMSDMLSPWLGNQKSILNDLPLPTLIAVEMKERNTDTLSSITTAVRKTAPEAIIDAHEEWLVDLLKLTKSLRVTALVIFALILGVTAFVISGAVRSRMAIHQRELELLHIMGASDSYISLQFIRYIFTQSLKGIFIGILLGIISLSLFIIYTDQSGGTLPSITVDKNDMIMLGVIPALLIIIGLFTARHTVLRVLNEMP